MKTQNQISDVIVHYFGNGLSSTDVMEELQIDEENEDALSNILSEYQEEWNKYLEEGGEEYNGDEGDRILEQCSSDIQNLYE